jgi:hypothetical protein
VMNGNGMGATLKSAAERHGAHYVAIVPGWAQTERILRERGFPLEAEVAAAAPLTHRPLAAVGAPQQQELPAPAEMTPELQAFGEAVSAEHDAAEAAEEPAAENSPSGRTDQPVNENTVAQAKRILAKTPSMGMGELLALLRASGHPANANTRVALALVRRASRASAGLKPNGFRQSRSPRATPAAAVTPDPATPRTRPFPPELAAEIAAVTAGGALPDTVRSRAQQLAAALIDAGLEGTLTVATDGALSFDLEQRRRLSGRASF